MLSIRKVDNPPDPEAPYLVQLSDYVSVKPFVKDNPLNTLNYYCDKKHLHHFVIEILKVFEDEIPQSICYGICRCIDEDRPFESMTDERINAFIKALGMFSENIQRQRLGYSMAYTEEAFLKLLK